MWSREVWQSYRRVFESKSEDRGCQVSQDVVCLSIFVALGHSLDGALGAGPPACPHPVGLPRAAAGALLSPLCSLCGKCLLKAAMGQADINEKKNT